MNFFIVRNYIILCQCWRYEEDYGQMPTLGSDTSDSDASSVGEDEDIPIYLLAGIKVSKVKSMPVSKKTLRREKHRERMQKKRKDLKYKEHQRRHMQKKRKCPKYQEQEKIAMAQKRDDPIFRENERARKRDIYHQKDLNFRKKETCRLRISRRRKYHRVKLL